MKRKMYEKIKYVAISFIVALSLVVSVNAPCLFHAEDAADSYIENQYYLDVECYTYINTSMVQMNDYYVLDLSDSYGGPYICSNLVEVDYSSSYNDFRFLYFNDIYAYVYDIAHYDFQSGLDPIICIGSYEDVLNGTCCMIPISGLGEYLSRGGTSDKTFDLSCNRYYEFDSSLSTFYIGVYVPALDTTANYYAEFTVEIEIDSWVSNIDSEYMWLYNSLVDLYGIDSDILNAIDFLLVDLQSVEDKISSIYDYIVKNYNLLYSINSNISTVLTRLTSLQSVLNNINTGIGDINEELDNQSTWLEKIWNSIQEFLSPDEESQDKQNDFNNSVNNQVGELGNLSGSLEFSKPDINDINVNVNTYLPQEYIDNYSELLKVFTNHTIVKDMLLVAFTICIISYTLFGKRR